MKKSVQLFLLLLIGVFVNAQTSSSLFTSEKKVGVGIHAGSQGLGLNGAYNLVNQFAVRLSASYAPYGFSDVRTWSNNSYDLDMKSKLGNVLLQAEYRPFNVAGNSKLLQKLAVTAGAAYFYKSEATAKGVPNNDYQLGDLTIDKSEIGTINATSTWNSVAPYAGLALREMKLSSALSLNVDLGSHYLSAPKVSLVGDKLLSGNQSNEAQMQKNLENYRWLPVLQLGFSYNL